MYSSITAAFVAGFFLGILTVAILIIIACTKDKRPPPQASMGPDESAGERVEVRLPSGKVVHGYMDNEG